MSFSVRNIGDQALRLSEFTAYQLHNVDVAYLIVSADVVDLADLPVLKDHVDCLAVILNIQPVTDIQPLSVYRQRLVVQRMNNHKRDQLLRELIRSVIVGTAGDRHRQAVCPVICQHQQIGTRLR